MRRMIIGLCAWLLLVLDPTLSVSASDPNQEILNKYSWGPTNGNMSNLPLLGYHFGILDNFVQGFGAMSMSKFGVTDSPNSHECEGFSDVKCQALVSAGESWFGYSVLPPCKDRIDRNFCIEGVMLKDQKGIRELKLKRVIYGPNWLADADHGFMPGSEPSLWEDPLNPDSLAGYKVTVSGYLSFPNNSIKTPNPVPAQLSLATMEANVSAYTELHGDSFKGFAKYVDSKGFVQWGFYPPVGCTWEEQGFCGATTEFPSNAQISLILHLPIGLSSWLTGRVVDPEVQVTDMNESAPNGKPLQRIRVSAAPVSVPLFAQDIPLDKIPITIQNSLFNSLTGFCRSGLYCQHGYPGGNLESAGSLTFTLYNVLHELLDPKANLLMPLWSFGTLQDDLLRGDCASKNFDGMVSTNASIYEGKSPSWDGTSLNYKVAGLHLDPNGDVFHGSYDLLLSSNYARCLYKFSNAPISATISVSDSAGTQSVATSTFSESNGWVHMAARGFTFSSPTIKVSLKQEKKNESIPSTSSKPSPSITPTPSSSPPVSTATTPQKPTSITCLKGKLVKKVSGLKPVCPAGYKKK